MKLLIIFFSLTDYWLSLLFEISGMQIVTKLSEAGFPKLLNCFVGLFFLIIALILSINALTRWERGEKEGN